MLRVLAVCDSDGALIDDDPDEYGISGNKLTPYILQRVVELTEGRSLSANKALLLNNARTAALLARKAGLGRAHPGL